MWSSNQNIPLWFNRIRHDGVTSPGTAANVSDIGMTERAFIFLKNASTNDTCLFLTLSLIDQPSMSSSMISNGVASDNETCLRVTLQNDYLEYSERLEYSLFAFLPIDAHRSIRTASRKRDSINNWNTKRGRRWRTSWSISLYSLEHNIYVYAQQ